MQRIFSYNLAILFYLLQGKTLHIPLTGKIRKESLDSSFDSLESSINGSDTPIDMRFCRDIENNDYVVSVEESQKHILKEYLQKYCEELVNDRLYTEELPTYEWKHKRQEFIKELLESHSNLNCYHVLDVYKLYLIAPELMKGDYKIKIEIDTRFVPQSHNDSCHELFFHGNFKFNCTLNLSNILEEQKKAKPHVEEPETRRKIFTHKQQILYDYFEHKAKSGKFSFSKYDLSKFASIKKNALNSAISKLNMQYKEIYNTEEKLIEFDRGEEMYILKNVWNYKTFD